MIKKILISVLAYALFMNCGKKGTEPEPEPAPQIISGPEVTSITATSATISWATDQAADSKIQYGQIPGVYEVLPFRMS